MKYHLKVVPLPFVLRVKGLQQSQNKGMINIFYQI
jgi:hypothetical protein